MKLRSFLETLSFAISIINEETFEDNRSFESNFDDIMQHASDYIRRIVAEDTAIRAEDGLPPRDLSEIILEDYDNVVNETYQNSDISLISMKYIAVRYLSRHKDEIPALEAEIEERGLTFSEEENYTDNFHDNLLLALLAVKDDYNEYYRSMMETNGEYMDEIRSFTDQYGDEEGFKRYCDKYGNMKMLPYSTRRQIIVYAYYTVFGVRGLDESKLSPKSPVLKIKAANFLKDYLNSYLERLEPVYRENLEDSILSSLYQLECFGELEDNIKVHNERMKRVGLPGLGYYLDEVDENGDIQPGNEKLPKISELVRSGELRKLDIDVLLRMNSFYNNRFAKVLNDYSMALYVLDNTNSLESVIEGETMTTESLGKSTLDSLMVKYQTLILPIKAFYSDVQRQIERNPKGFADMTQDVELGEEDSRVTKKQVVYEIDGFTTDLNRVWGEDYETYFSRRLPHANNDLTADVELINTLYNPIFLSYRFKNLSLKSEYAYLHYLSMDEPEKSLNFGAVIKKSDEGKSARKTLLLASEGGVNLPNRLHTFKREFADFLQAYTGKPLVRIYEGFSDFFVGGEYISSQLILPTSKQHLKYIKEIRRGKLSDKGDTLTRLNELNEKFVNHINYCLDSSKFMDSYKENVVAFDKKGNQIVEKKQPVRYMDLTDGRIYHMVNGELIERKTGRRYGQNTNERELERDE